MSDKTNFHWRIAELQTQIDTLRSDAIEAPTKHVLDEVFTQLVATLEELQVAEEELQEQSDVLSSARNALLQEQDRYRQLFEFAPDAYVVTDLHGIIRRANQPAVRLLNLELDFLVGKPLTIFVSNDNRQRFRSILSQMNTSGASQTEELMLIPRHRENPISVIAMTTLIYNMTREPEAISWALIDITAQKQLENQLRALNAELEARVRERTVKLVEANQHKGELLVKEQQARAEAERANALKMKLLAMISHELRTPLTSIKGFASTLLATDIDWDIKRWRAFVSVIDEEADKLTDLVEQLLDLSRLQAGALSITPDYHSLAEITHIAHAQIETLTSDHLLQIDIPSDLPPVYADSRRIAQVLVNLVNNAVKFSPQGSHISISARPKADAVETCVADEGSGIPVTEQDQVFQVFYQRDDPLVKRSGAGLGLAICKGLVEQHNGRIWIEKSDEQGTSICFALPTAPPM